MPSLALVADAATEFAAAPNTTALGRALARRLARAASAEQTAVWLASRPGMDELTLTAAYPSDHEAAAVETLSLSNAPLAEEAFHRGAALQARLSAGPAALGLDGRGDAPVWAIPIVAGTRRLGIAYAVTSRMAVHHDHLQRVLTTLGCQAALAAAALVAPLVTRQDDAEFLAVVAHDLKNVATSIKGYTQLVRRHLPAESASRAGRWTGIVEEQVGVLTSTLSALVDLGRLQSGRHALDLELIDLEQVVTAVAARLAADGTGPPLRVHSSTTNLLGAWDGRRLERALQAALDTTRRAAASDADAVDVVLAAEDGWASLQLGTPDRGAWPAADAWVAGADASLYLLRGLVALHGGTTAYERTANGEPVLRVCLPLSRPAGR